jgi:ABC-type sugar transport system permease subunit
LIMAVFIVFPTLNTFVLSFMDRTGTRSAAVDCVAGQPCLGAFEN